MINNFTAIVSNRELFYTLCIGLLYSLIICALILTENTVLSVAILSLSVIYFLYHKYFEGLIVLTLVINQEFFYLLPSMGVGKNYQDGLYAVIVFIGVLFFARKRPNNKDLSFFVLAFLGITMIGVLQAYFMGQSIVAGLKAAKGFYLILLYFVFLAKEINLHRLYKLIVITGVGLTLLNNIQYIFFDKIQIFNDSRSFERFGELRLLTGDFFTIFAPITALAIFLASKKRIYLMACIYMILTVVVQGKTRAVVFGISITIITLLYLSKSAKIKYLAIVSIPILLLMLLSPTIIQNSTTIQLAKITLSDFTTLNQGKNNINIRLAGYSYYWREFLRSPVWGQGVWNAITADNNPQNMTGRGIYLSDVGFMSLLFQFGLMGAVWLLFVLKKCMQMIPSLKKDHVTLYFLTTGYLVFSLSAFVTLDSFLARRTIIYFALILALISQKGILPLLSTRK